MSWTYGCGKVVLAYQGRSVGTFHYDNHVMVANSKEVVGETEWIEGYWPSCGAIIVTEGWSIVQIELLYERWASMYCPLDRVYGVYAMVALLSVYHIAHTWILSMN